MKKIIKLLILCFVIFSVTSCTEIIDETLETKQREIYLLAQEAGYSGTYEEWLESIKGAKGEDGVGIASIEKTNTEDNVDTYTIIYTNATSTNFTVTNGKNGVQGIQGVPGKDGHTPVITIQNGNWFIDGVDTLQSAAGLKGDKGDTGNGISSIKLTSTEGLVDTYTITFTDGTTTTFTVTNGKDGEDGVQGIQGIQGVPGKDGHTPVITIQNGNWYIDGVDTLQSAIGIKGDKGDTGNGISSIKLTSTEGLVDTYTITFTDGTTTTFTVTNGVDGEDGAQGIQGIQGEKGEDGHTPVITIQDGYWYIDGVNTNVLAEGVKGETGNGISSIKLTKTEGLVDTYTITFTNGTTSTFTVTNGKDGEDGVQGIQGIQGEKGEDGHTPVITIQDGYWYIDGVNTNVLAEGVKGETGNGISSIKLTNTEGLVDTYTITFTNGTTTTFTVTNGKDGVDGAQGIQGIQGEKGEDGHTPVITIQDGYWYIDGVNTNVLAEGVKGETGNGISKIEKTGTLGIVDTYTIYFTDGTTSTFTVTNGKDGVQGIQGEKGEDGHTPIISIVGGYWYIDGVNTNVCAEIQNNNIRFVELGEFVTYKPTTSTINLTSFNNKYLTMESVIGVPYDNVKLCISINSNYKVKVQSSNNHGALRTESAWLLNGDEYNIPSGHIYFRVYITSIDENIELESSMLEEINLYVGFDNTSDVVLENTEQIKYIESLRSDFINGRVVEDKYPVIVHGTDVHGDVTRLENMIAFSEYIDANFIALSGDLTAYNVHTGYSSIANAYNKSKVNVIFATGNHDINGVELSRDGDSLVYNALYKEAYQNNSDYVYEIINGEPSTWYYCDDEEYKIRMISLNSFERAGASGNTMQVHYNQAQIDFFINALSTMEEDYGCMIVYHCPEQKLSSATKKDDTFYQGTWGYNAICPLDYDGNIIIDIVDAFIGKTTINNMYLQEYTYNSDYSAYSDYLYANADFTSCRGEFIAHMTGHFHQDAICYMPNSVYNQVVLNQTCTTSSYGTSGGYPNLADLSDLPRDKSNLTENSFNTYIIDKDNKEIHIVRVGSNLTFELEEREYTKISYFNAVFDTYVDLEKFTQVEVSLDPELWINSKVGENGIGSDGSNNLRLAYSVPFVMPTSKTICVTMNGMYNFGIRSGDSTTNLPNNQYWYKSGDVVELKGNEVYYIILRKVAVYNQNLGASNDIAISDKDLENLDLKLYVRNDYTLVKKEIDVSDENKWVNATVSQSGIGAPGSRTNRLTYNVIFDVPEGKKMSIKLNGMYQWGVRSGSSETSYENNQYWFNTGDVLEIAGENKLMFVIRKVTDLSDRSSDKYTIDITYEDLEEMGIEVYFYE